MFWPFMLASLLLSGIGAYRRQAAWFLGGALLSLPLAWYLLASPLLLFDLLGAIVPLCHLAGAVAAWRRQVLLAWAFLLPPTALTAWVAFVVATQ